jgi:hypothetical protein
MAEQQLSNRLGYDLNHRCPCFPASLQLLGDHLHGIEHPLPATHDSELFAVSLRSARGTTSGEDKAGCNKGDQHSGAQLLLCWRCSYQHSLVMAD